MKKRAAYLITCIFLVPLISMGQSLEENASPNRSSETMIELERTILLEKDSQTEEVIFEIDQKTQRLELLIRSSVSNGKVTIELYDPKETKQGNFTVSTLLNSEKQEIVDGRISKLLVEPQAGKWKVKIIPVNATGRIKIHTVIGG